MKHFSIALLSALLITANVFAQDCQDPVSPAVFQSNFNVIAVQHTNQKKLEQADLFVNSNCLTAAQVKNIAQLFTDDSYRLDFCKNAYLHTFDRVNFYDVYDTFTKFSYAFRLNDYIHELDSNTASNTTTVTVNPPPHAAPVFPNYSYPAIAAYNGKKGCAGPVISDDAFNNIAQNVFSQPTDESKVVAIQSASNANCLSFAMIMKLSSLVGNESLRLSVMENTFSKVFDLENYPSGTQLFTDNNNQAAWLNYAKNTLTPPPAPCVTSDADFNTVLASVHSKPFDNDKMSTLQLAAKDRCFSVAQIRKLAAEFAFSDAKLKVFKMLYAKCNDQQDYYQCLDDLTFSTEKDDLSNFIKNGGK
ncbi:MAG TPA: DUF4476 domain-containing protein [Bacteroidia bacterium]|nr:DUF4476 domain-containing protein [Bacteroidia bacterium]